ncbi:MAG TPA: S8 family serine peptidase [Candidatus Limnocylindrales bacterium]
MTLHLHRSRWGSVLIGLLAVTLATNPVWAGAANTTGDKVSPAVRTAAEQSEKITFWVVFGARTNLAAAQGLTAKAAKGAEVRRAKLATANSSQAEVRKLLDSAGADYQTFWISNRIKVTGQAKLLDTLAARPEVTSIEPLASIKMPEPQFKPADDASVQAVEWGIDRIGAPQAWSQFGARGQGIVVASIDSGVQFDHPALVTKYRGRDANGGFDHNYNWFDPSDVCPTAAPCDNNDHGTHTMGTMVGDDGAGNQIGVAPDAKWIAAKGCETNFCSDAALLASGEWIVAPTDLNGQNPRPDLAPDIVNNSWGSSGLDTWYKEIVQSWVAAGIFPAFSNGNAGPSCNTSSSPGQYIESYSSGAFDINNNIAGFSSRGTGEAGGIKPNLSAPGVAVRSSVPGNAYALGDGTSMASPHTAGTVALMWSAAPAIRNNLAETIALLDITATDVNATACGGTVADNNVFGEGRLNAFVAVSQSPRPPVGAFGGTITSGGSPLADVTVVADGPIDRTTTTAADGTYSFPLLTAGDYAVTASKFGFVPATATATVTEGTTATLDLTLAASTPATISGTVTADGAPLAGATVSLGGTPLSAVTNAAGAYSLTAPQGLYQLTVAGPMRCYTPVTQTVTLTADVTVNVSLPVRTDSFGYACSAASGTFPTLTNLLALTGDDAQTTVTLPFPVPLYGTAYTSASVTTNGSVAFGAASQTQTNVAIPATSAPNGALYPLWDDWFVDSAAGVYTGVVGSVPNRRFVIEWRNIRSFFDSNQRVSFVAEIGEDGSVTYRYKDVAGTSFEAGSSATIGLENATGTVAYQYSLNEAVLSDGTAIGFRTTQHGVVRGTVTDANDGLPIAGASVSFGAAGSTTTGTDGTYVAQVSSGNLTATISKPNYETMTANVTLVPASVQTINASLRTAKVTVAPGSLVVVVPAGQSRTRVVNVTNSGGISTPVTVEEVGGDVPWLGSSLASGTLAAGASTKLTVTVDATGMTPGTFHEATLRVSSQSGRQPEILIPVRLVVPGFQEALDSGANGSHVDSFGDTWERDARFVAGEGCGWMGTSNVVTTNRAIAGTDDPGRFANARQNMFEYRCDGLADGTYTVELDFAEIAGLKPNKRIFDVMIEGVEVIPNLDIALEADGAYRALNRTFVVDVTGGVLNIRFVAHAGFNKTLVNALRVTHRPDL